MGLFKKDKSDGLSHRLALKDAELAAALYGWAAQGNGDFLECKSCDAQVSSTLYRKGDSCPWCGGKLR